MRLCYLQLSPTFGIHQYTADLANRMRHHFDVHLITTTTYPADRYDPAGNIHTPITTHNTTHLKTRQLRQLQATLTRLQPHLIHLTGPHLHNLRLLHWLKRQKIPTLHTLHDLQPHSGTKYGRTLLLWNHLITRWADHILVHGQIYHTQLTKKNIPTTYTPLLHLFLSHQTHQTLTTTSSSSSTTPTVLFFGRLEAYKGLNTLLTAWQHTNKGHLIIAGPGTPPPTPLPPRVTLHNQLISDTQALHLFQHCSLVILPYHDATQSAIIPAAYYFQKPVLATRTGALPEYIIEGKTGWLVEPSHPTQLATQLNHALNNPHTLQQMGHTGRAWYTQQRQTETTTLLTLYHKLAVSR